LLWEKRLDKYDFGLDLVEREGVEVEIRMSIVRVKKIRSILSRVKLI
jgi:hypothetical protein